MVHHTFPIITMPNETISVFCFGDLQTGAEGFAKEAWEEFKYEFKKTKNAYAIGLGDYTDWLRPTMRARIYSQLSHDDSARKQLDDKVRMEQDRLIDQLNFMSGKLIGLHQGHHDWEFITGMNSTQRLAEALKAPYIGWQASTRVILDYTAERRKTKSTLAYTIISTHGNANGRRIGSGTLWLENNLMQGWIADQYIMGHGCKSANWAPVERNIIRRRGPPGATLLTPRCLMVGGFHNGYTNGWDTSYVERSGFVPQPVMWGVIRLRICKKVSVAKIVGKSPLSDIIDIENVNRGPGASAFLYAGSKE